MLPSVVYPGHMIMSEGLQPMKENMRAIVEAPAPQNVLQLRSFFLVSFIIIISFSLSLQHISTTL